MKMKICIFLYILFVLVNISEFAPTKKKFSFKSKLEVKSATSKSTFSAKGNNKKVYVLSDGKKHMPQDKLERPSQGRKIKWVSYNPKVSKSPAIKISLKTEQDRGRPQPPSLPSQDVKIKQTQSKVIRKSKGSTYKLQQLVNAAKAIDTKDTKKSDLFRPILSSRSPALSSRSPALVNSSLAMAQTKIKTAARSVPSTQSFNSKTNLNQAVKKGRQVKTNVKSRTSRLQRLNSLVRSISKSLTERWVPVGAREIPLQKTPKKGGNISSQFKRKNEKLSVQTKSKQLEGKSVSHAKDDQISVKSLRSVKRLQSKTSLGKSDQNSVPISKTENTLKLSKPRCTWVPVCGSDGFTYPSDCHIASPIFKACDGYCPCPRQASAKETQQARILSHTQKPSVKTSNTQAANTIQVSKAKDSSVKVSGSALQNVQAKSRKVNFHQSANALGSTRQFRKLVGSSGQPMQRHSMSLSQTSIQPRQGSSQISRVTQSPQSSDRSLTQLSMNVAQPERPGQLSSKSQSLRNSEKSLASSTVSVTKQSQSGLVLGQVKSSTRQTQTLRSLAMSGSPKSQFLGGGKSSKRTVQSSIPAVSSTRTTQSLVKTGQVQSTKSKNHYKLSPVLSVTSQLQPSNRSQSSTNIVKSSSPALNSAQQSRFGVTSRKTQSTRNQKSQSLERLNSRPAQLAKGDRSSSSIGGKSKSTFGLPRTSGKHSRLTQLFADVSQLQSKGQQGGQLQAFRKLSTLSSSPSSTKILSDVRQSKSGPAPPPKPGSSHASKTSHSKVSSRSNPSPVIKPALAGGSTLNSTNPSRLRTSADVGFRPPPDTGNVPTQQNDIQSKISHPVKNTVSGSNFILPNAQTTPVSTMSSAPVLNCGCPDMYIPVCGTDGYVYYNECELICSDMNKECDGECPCRKATKPESQKLPESIPKELIPPEQFPSATEAPFCSCPVFSYDPVCGVDGQTYDNRCLLNCEGVNFHCDGPCPCIEGGRKYRYELAGPCNHCSPWEWDPVCGTDGHTYRSFCYSECHAASIQCSSECPC